MYFVMVNVCDKDHDRIELLTGWNKEAMPFATREEAEAAGKDDYCGSQFGYEVFETGTGV